MLYKSIYVVAVVQNQEERSAFLESAKVALDKNRPALPCFALWTKNEQGNVDDETSLLQSAGFAKSYYLSTVLLLSLIGVVCYSALAYASQIYGSELTYFDSGTRLMLATCLYLSVCTILSGIVSTRSRQKTKRLRAWVQHAIPPGHQVIYLFLHCACSDDLSQLGLPSGKGIMIDRDFEGLIGKLESWKVSHV